MRIFKNNSLDVLLDLTAKEMINIEAGTQLFNYNMPISDKKKGYPYFVKDNVEYSFNSCEGFVFLSSSIDRNSFIKKLLIILERLEKGLDDPYNGNHLLDFQSICSQHLTALKIKNSQKLTKYIQQGEGVRIPLYNIKRLLVLDYRGDYVGMQPRFTWYFCYISSFIIDYHSHPLISKFVSSIFIDIDDISKFSNTDLDFNFSYKCIKSFDNIIMVPIQITGFFNHIFTNINPFYTMMPGGVFRYELINKNPALNNNLERFSPIDHVIYHADFNQLLIRDPSICHSCKFTLYDDNYVVILNDSDYGVAFCPPCLHLQLPAHISYIFRVTFKTTVRDVIMSLPSPKKDILLEFIDKGWHVLSYNDIPYISISDKYLVFHSIAEYIYIGHLFPNKFVCFESLLNLT